MTWGEYLREYRNIHKLSQRDLSVQMGISDMTLSRMERGGGFRASAGMLAPYGYDELEEIVTLTADTAGFTQLKQMALDELNGGKGAENSPSAYDFGWSLGDVAEKLLSNLEFKFAQDALPLGEVNIPNDAFYYGENAPDDIKCWRVYLLPDHTQGIKEMIFFLLGKDLLLNCPDRITFFTDAMDYNQIKKWLGILPYNFLPMDFTFIIVSKDRKIVQEYALCENRNGGGIFDLDVQGSEDESRIRYIKWMEVLQQWYPVR